MRAGILFPVISWLVLMTICVLLTVAKLQQIKPGCRYEGKRYQEFDRVNTSEPCLHCRCLEGSLRCRLRVCPRLPTTLPPGCITKIPHDNACCAELVCKSSYTDAVTLPNKSSSGAGKGGCYWEGVFYGPGSAMIGSRRCEYCYCIAEERRCVRPKCLLPLPGCIPLYAPYSCCPVSYNCTHSLTRPDNGCKVGDVFYKEGEMIRHSIKKASCDNCFCAMGNVRCVPLSCAPPLQGCTPIVREGHCCPSTYNCSGSIEVKAEQNYASYAFISKDYAKFRKETNFLLIQELVNSTSESEARSNRDSAIPPTAEDHSQSSTADFTLSTLTYETETMNNEIPTEAMDDLVTTVDAETPTEPWTSTVDGFTTAKTSLETSTVIIENTTPDIIFETTKLHAESKMDAAEKSPATVLMPDNIFIMNVTVKTNVSVGIVHHQLSSMADIVNITDGKKSEDYDYDYNEPTLPPSLPNVRIIPFVAADALVKDKEIASSATGVAPKLVVPSTDISATSGSFYVTQENGFSPPVKTEGGFLPREPPYYPAPYHSTDLNLEIGTGVTVVSPEMTNPLGKNDGTTLESVNNCLFEGHGYQHGEILPSSGHCIICICYYGEVVCTDEKCLPVKFGCRRISDNNSCCGEISCDAEPQESPTVVLNTADSTIVSMDPFRDVIKTERAPDLPALIEDMIPYFAEHQISTPPSITTTGVFEKNSLPSTTTTKNDNSTTTEAIPVSSSIAAADELTTTTTTMTTMTTTTTTTMTTTTQTDTAMASGLLKLAGCNIYGRMYRVGRIIAELSSPCLECRCTEIGVQCKQLKC